MDRIMRHPRVQKTINNPRFKKVVNKKTIAWFAVIKLIIYIFTAGFFAFNAIHAKADFGINPSVTQVKAANSGTIYYLDHASGQKKGYINSTVFQSYGHKKTEVVTVSAANLQKWSDAEFIRAKDGTTIYYIKGKYKSAVHSKTVLENLGYSDDKLMVVNSADFLSYKTIGNDRIGIAHAIKTLASQEPETVSVTKDSTTAKQKPDVGGDDTLLIAHKLAVERDDSLLQSYLVAGSTHNLVASYRLSTADQAVKIRGLLLNVNGVYSSNSVKKITVEIAGTGKSYEATLTDRVAKTNFGPDYIVIPAQSHINVAVYLDMYNFASANNTISFVLPQGENILTDVSVGGHFPVSSPVFKLADGNGLLGNLTIEEQKLNNSNLIFGSTDSIVARYKLAETSGTEDLVIESITFANAGGLSPDTISNLKLKDNYNQDIGSASLYTDSGVVFKNLNYKIKKSQNRILTLYATIGGVENYSSNLNITSIVANGQNYGYNVAANIANDDTRYTISRLNVAVESAELITTKASTKYQSGTVIGNFRLKNGNQTLTAQELNLTFGKNSSAPNLKENLYLVNYETGELLDNKPASNPIFHLHNMVLKPYQTLKLAVITNLPDSAGNNDWYWLNFNTITYRYPNNLVYNDLINVNGNVFYATQASVYAYRDIAQPEKELQVTRGKKSAKVASFILESADSVDALIKNISFKQGSETDNRLMAATGFTNVKLVVGSQTSGKTIASPTADTYQFDNVNYKLTAGKRLEVNVYADVSTNASVNDVQLAINNINAVNANTNVTAQISGTGVNANKVAIGSLTGVITVNSGGSYTPGTKNNLLGTFEVKNSGNEPIYLKNITLADRGQKFSYSSGFSNLRITKAGGTSRLGSITNPVSEVNKISLGYTKIEAGSSLAVEVRVDAKNTAPSNNAEIFINQIEISGVNSLLTSTIAGDASQALVVTAGASENPTGLSLNWPTSSHSISYGFDDPNYPYKSYGEHTGVDIITAQGSSVYAAADGEVVDVTNENSSASYNYITIKHANGLNSTYGHLSRIDVKIGDKVISGQKIGLSGGRPGTVGAGPYSNGAHLHFEVTLNGALVDPLAYIQ